MRLFYALWPDDTTRIQLAQRRNDVVRLSGGRPSTPDSLHMTLVYIGEVPDTRFDEVCAIGDRMVHAGFDYPVDTTACFDSASCERRSGVFLSSASPVQLTKAVGMTSVAPFGLSKSHGGDVGSHAV